MAKKKRVAKTTKKPRMIKRREQEKKKVSKKKPTKKTTKRKSNAGRKKLPISAEEVEKLASYGCTGEEIADALGVARSTIYDRFSDNINKGHANQKKSLRKTQWDLAMGGNPTMNIWLGKQYLGQADKTETKDTSDELRIAGKTPAQVLDDIIETLRGK